MTLITPNPSVDLLSEALGSLGYTCERLQLGVGRNSYTRYISPSGKAWVTRNAYIGYPFTNSTITSISSRKDLAYEFCATYGIRVPRTIEFRADYSDEMIHNALLGGPLVVKPHNSSLSRGLSLNVTDGDSLRQALDVAFEFSLVALVQEQIKGEEIRFVLVGGNVKAAILRESPRLTGDGRHSLRELLEDENDDRAKLDMPYITYPQLQPELIVKAGRNPDDIPGEGEAVSLGKGTMIRDGASMYNVLPDVHSSYLEIVSKLNDALGAQFLVVDMMLEDYRAPQTATNYAFIEFNTAPVLKLFYSCRDSKHYDVLSDLVPVIDRTVRGGEA